MTNSTMKLKAAVRERFPPPEWAVAFEVQFPREEGGLRFADAIAIDTRKGAGFAVHGLELKVSRGDWLAEVRPPRKADPGRSVCDYWWVVEGSVGVVRPGELPDGVGLLRMRGDDLFLGVQAKDRRIREDLRAGAFMLDRSLVAAFLRRLNPDEPRAFYDAKVREAERRGIAKGRNEAARIQRKQDREGTAERPVGPGGLFCP